GEMAVPFIYDELGNANHGLMAFERDSLSGYVDWDGKEQFSRLFEFASDFNEGYATVRVEGLYGAIDTTGSYTIPALYDWIEASGSKLSRVRKGELYGVYEHGYQMRIPLKYRKLGEKSSGLYAFQSDLMLGYLDEYGDTVIIPRFELESNLLDRHAFINGHAVVIENGKEGLVDISGNYVIEPVYDELKFSGENILVFRLKNRWGHIKIDGNVLPGLYDSVSEFEQGLAIVEEEGRKGIVTSLGKLLVPIKYDNLRPIPDTELIVFESEGYKGIMSREAEVILEAEYDEITPFNIRFAKLTLEGKDQLYDLMDAEVRWSSVAN
ncbi:MAG: WG repeat-containing protein, partial [Flavobacteriales bacterium]|nr:WG repeat-containing protein [Flavobacteriales bacterium]